MLKRMISYQCNRYMTFCWLKKLTTFSSELIGQEFSYNTVNEAPIRNEISSCEYQMKCHSLNEKVLHQYYQRTNCDDTYTQLKGKKNIIEIKKKCSKLHIERKKGEQLLKSKNIYLKTFGQKTKIEQHRLLEPQTNKAKRFIP